MTPRENAALSAQQKTALISVGAALGLIALKVTTGLITGSLAFISGALDSGLDLVTALMTLFAVGLAARPADVEHPWGHAKVEHLAALAESSLLFLASIWIAYTASQRLASSSPPEVEATWWAILVILIVMSVDAGRAVVSFRASIKHRSAALQSNALNFIGDLLGSAGVLVGLIFVRAGYPKADSIAAIFIAAIVLYAAARLAFKNADILIDRSPRSATEMARQAIDELDPPVDLKQLRVREGGGRYYAEVVIGVSPEAAVGEGHAAADQIEKALEGMLHGGEVVVHVEPESETKLTEAVRAAAMSVRGVREIHNLTVADLEGRHEASLHLKLPGDLNLASAHELASQVEQAIMKARPEIAAVVTHLEPLDEEVTGVAAPRIQTRDYGDVIRAVVRKVTGAPPKAVRFVRTDEGLVVNVIVALNPEITLSEAHKRASEIEQQVHRKCAGIKRLVIHTEP
ncbi:MAG TPA: cation diffusion facilitator family transporter [Gaiellaceae bacterium]